MFAVPRGTKVPDWRDIFDKPEWVTKKLPDSLQSAPLQGPDGPLTDQHNKWVFRYAVGAAGDTLQVELIQSTAPPFDFPYCIAAIACVVSAVLAVVVILVMILTRTKT